MFEKHRQLYYKVVFIFTLATAIYTLFGRFTWLHALVEHTVNSYIYAFIGIFGLVLLAVDFFVYHDYRKMRYYAVYLIFIGCAAISSILNFKYGYIDNGNTICWLLMQMGLYTTMGQIFTKERYHKWLTYFFSISGCIWGFAALVSLYQFLFVDGYLIFMNNREIRQSLYDNRLFGVFIDPNLGAFVGLLVIIGMVYLMKQYRSKLLHTACIINSVIQLLYIILSGSRSTEVCLIVTITYVGIYRLYRFFKTKEDSRKILHGICYLAIPIITAFFLTTSFEVFRSGASAIALEVSPEHHTDANELVRQDIEGNETNNRTDIWKGYIELVKDKPIFGLSPRNAWNYADATHPDNYIARHHYDVHNAYIAVFAGMGIVGVLALALLLWCILKTIIPRAFDVKAMNPQYFTALLFIINIAVFIMFYPGIFFTNGIDTVLFWPAIGFTLQDAKPFSFFHKKKATK